LAWRALPLDIELMPQYQDFGLPAAAATRRLLQSCDDCPDSQLTATQLE
jgi:hypothetical protein